MKPAINKRICLNLGCGDNKIPGFVNIDVETSVKPDQVCDFIRQTLPYKTGSVHQVVLFHTIEHIEKQHHRRVLGEVYRVLKPKGIFLISYPEWLKCAENWISNYKGMKDFWEKTLYGRQLFPSDYHVCILHTPDFRMTLMECGFQDIEASSEPVEKYNTVIRAVKGQEFANYEQLAAADMRNTKIIQETPQRGKEKKRAH